MPDIIRCPDCKKETYAGLVSCPHCGYRFYRLPKDSPTFDPEQSIDKSQDTVLKPDSGRASALSLIAVVFFSGFLLMHYFDKISHYESLFGFITLGGLLAYTIALLGLKVPRLTFNKGGLRYNTMFNAYSWKWSEVGQFSIVNRGSFVKEKLHLYAQAGHTRGSMSWFGTFGTDLDIDLSVYRVSGTETSAQSLADHLNKMRKAYG